MTLGAVISVTVRLQAPELAGQLVAENDEPGRDSLTVPPTLTCCPGLTLGALDVNTKMPSDVAGLPSPSPSCM
jgi:hypothetical protein